MQEKLNSRYKPLPPVEGATGERYPLPYGGLVNVYRNELGTNDPRVVTCFHGGRFVMGSTKEDDTFCRELCVLCDVVVLSIDYHLAAQTPFTSAIEGSMSELDYSKEFSPKPATLMGFGAGANLALAVALKAHAGGLGDHVKGMVAMSPLVMHPDGMPAGQKPRWTSLDANNEHSYNSRSAITSWLAVYGAPPKEPWMSVLACSGLCAARYKNSGLTIRLLEGRDPEKHIIKWKSCALSTVCERLYEHGSDSSDPANKHQRVQPLSWGLQ